MGAYFRVVSDSFKYSTACRCEHRDVRKVARPDVTDRLYVNSLCVTDCELQAVKCCLIAGQSSQTQVFMTNNSDKSPYMNQIIDIIYNIFPIRRPMAKHYIRANIKSHQDNQ